MDQLLNLNSDQKRTTRQILLAIAVAALLILMFFAGRGYQKKQPSPAEEYLKEQIVQYEQEAGKWRDQVTVLQGEKTELEQSITALENKLKTIKSYYDQKVITVSSYSNAELEQFFADRYPE